jgi:hypothetical protein
MLKLSFSLAQFFWLRDEIFFSADQAQNEDKIPREVTHELDNTNQRKVYTSLSEEQENRKKMLKNY